MKRISINLLTNVVLLLAGILLLIFFNQANVLTWVARIMGVMFLLPSLAYLIMVATRPSGSRSNTDYMGILPVVGGVCFGVIMLIKAELFSGVLSILLGVLLLVLGLFHLFYLALSHKALSVKGHYYLLPLVVGICGVLVLFVPAIRDATSTMVLITGVCLLLFNITSLQEYLVERRVRKAAVKAAAAKVAASSEKPATEVSPSTSDNDE